MPLAVVYDVGVIVTGGGGGVGRVAVPGVFISVAVVCKPVASRIENVSGLTHVPLVTASNEPPLVFTGEPRMVTASGKVDVTRYGGVPP